MTKRDLFLECKDDSTHKNRVVLYTLRKWKGEKKITIISVNAKKKKAFDKIQHLFVINKQSAN